jgi:hypothetical protein
MRRGRFRSSLAYIEKLFPVSRSSVIVENLSSPTYVPTALTCPVTTGRSAGKKSGEWIGFSLARSLRFVTQSPKALYGDVHGNSF